MTLLPARTISPPAWMTAPETVAVMAALNAVPDRARFVGGCVRNSLLGLASGDLDIATAHRPEQATALLEKAGIRVVPTGIDHGTVTAVLNGHSFEITTLRRDVETDGRRAVVAFTTDWGEDARRRDFTMNTLLADGTGHIYDPTGQGLADLEARRVLFVGDAGQRIAEDYLRILRFFRFHAYYGKGDPDKVALAACRAAAAKIPTLSRERITQEVTRLLALDDPAPVLRLMFENNVLTAISHKDYQPEVLSRLCRLQKKTEAVDFTARLLVLTGFDARQQAALDKYLVLSNAQKKEFASLSAMMPQLEFLSEKNGKYLIYKYSKAIAIQAVLLSMAIGGKDDPGLIATLQNWQPPIFPLTGNDIKKMGVPDGPETGRLLRIVQDWWLENDFAPDRAACLEKLSSIA